MKNLFEKIQFIIEYFESLDILIESIYLNYQDVMILSSHDLFDKNIHYISRIMKDMSPAPLGTLHGFCMVKKFFYSSRSDYLDIYINYNA